MPEDLQRVLGAIRAQPWAIMPDYLAAIEAIAARALDAGALIDVAADGHEDRLVETRGAVAAVGTPLEGAMYSTVRDGVAVVPILGPIFPRATLVNSSAGGAALDAIMRDLRVAVASADVNRIVLLVDSPGGVVSGLSEASEQIRAIDKPVSAFVTGMACSAAYWLAAQANEIVMDASAVAGNIGVILSSSKQVQADGGGRMTHEVVSSGAPMKRPDPETDEGRAALQQIVDDAEAVFVADVAKGRGVSVATVRSEFGRGAAVSGYRAVEAGLADRIGTLEGVLSEGRNTAPLNRPGARQRLAMETDQRRRAAQ